MDYKMIKYLILVSVMSGICAAAFCQEQESSIEDDMEEIMAINGDYDPAAFMEQLADLREFPVNINYGDEKENARLFFLTEFQVMVLTDHVRRNGDVVSLYELALLPAFDRSTVMLMAPYISLQPAVGSTEKRYGRTMVTMTASSRFTMADNDEPGARILLKVRHDGSRISYGVTAENDPGEPFTFRKAVGPDFLSGYMMFQGKGLISRVIIGDFWLRTGEGLLFNGSTLQGSWLSSPSFMAGSNNAAPYTSSAETGFFRGICLTATHDDYQAVFFLSYRSLDAGVLNDADGRVCAVSHLITGGIHVTDYQRRMRDNLGEAVAGLHLSGGTNHYRVGVTSSAILFSLPFQADMTAPDKIYMFTGDRLLNIAADFKAGTGPVLFFAEAAVSLPGSWAVTAGVRARPSPGVTFNILARHLSPQYHAFHSGAFRTGSGPGNETGLSASIHVEAARHLFIIAGADHCRIPLPRYRCSSPSVSSRAGIKGEYRPREDLSLKISYTCSSREYDTGCETGTSGSETVTRSQVALTFSHSPLSGLSLVTRASMSSISPSRSQGYLLCQDICLRMRAVPVRLWFRYALCSTDDYESRLYAYENDMLSSFSVPAMYGECTRTCLMISWKPSDHVEIRAKYAIEDMEEDHYKVLKHELKGQMRVVF
jgi:hypothetical protein